MKILLWYDRLELCDPWRLTAWQVANAPRLVPTMDEIEEHGLRRTEEEAARLNEIMSELISRGKA